MIRRFAIGLLTVILVGAAFWGHTLRQQVKNASLSTKLDQIVRVTNEPLVDCSLIAAQNPLVILALGQSNAANHGERTSTPSNPIILFANSKCILATDPLPGGTGSGSSIWSRLPRHLSMRNPKRPLVLSVIGIDATTITDWTSQQSPLPRLLTAHVKSMKAFGLLPQVVLWQQGEADARLGTSSEAYGAGLGKLANYLTDAGSDAPILLALSTVCRAEPNIAIRTAISTIALKNDRFKVGPDTDALNAADMRFDACHFSITGLNLAAKLWVSKLELIFASI